MVNKSDSGYIFDRELEKRRRNKGKVVGFVGLVEVVVVTQKCGRVFWQQFSVFYILQGK